MFGQSNSSPFGSSSGGFGQQNTTPAFGAPAPAFGAPAPAPAFGSTFGAPAPAPAFGGGFGSPSPAPAFGGGSTFGAPAPSAFGAPAPSGFGSSSTSSPFGAPAPAPTGGLFGAPAPAPAFGNTGGFGAPAPAPAFGGGFGSPSPAPAPGLFGAPAPAPSAFGAPAPATGLFGSTPAPAPFGGSGFGSAPAAPTFGAPAPSTGGIFGSTPAPAPVGGMFGSTPLGAPAGGGGTKGVSFQSQSRQDGNNSTSVSFHSITAMPTFENKSFEELRFEDYSQGNKGTATAQAPTSFGGFGAPAPAPTGGMFGSNPAPAPAFGAPAPSFGGSTFGSPSPAPAFGSTTFGAPSPAPAFGAPAPAFGAPAPTGGMFGSTPAPSTGGMFGSAPAPATGGLFGSPAPATGGLFGSSPAPAPFGANPAPAPGGGLFGAPAPAPGTSLFGAPSPAPAFGAPAPSTGFFGSSPAPATGGFGFGTPGPAPSGGLFGAPAPAPSGGLFGSNPAPAPFGAPAPASAGLFGAHAPPPAPLPGTPPVGSIIPPAASDILAQQLAAMEKQKKELESMKTWTSPKGASVIASSQKDTYGGFTSPKMPSHNPYRASPVSSAQILPRRHISASPSQQSSAVKSGTSTTTSTRLVIKPSPKPRLRLLLDKPPTPENESPYKLPPTNQGTPSPSIRSPTAEQQATPPPVTTPGSTTSQKSFDYYKSVVGSPDKSPPATTSSNLAPKLTKDGYICYPSIERLKKLPAEELAAVEGFSVEHSGYGKIEWEGAVDVRSADLDRIVVIGQSEASVYSQDEADGKKPSVGSKLNRSAVITLENVFPKKGGPNADEATRRKFENKIATVTRNMGAELVSYDSEEGTWRMRVEHFSRYGLDDDDSDEEMEDGKENFRSGGSGGDPRADGQDMGSPLFAANDSIVANIRKSPSKKKTVQFASGEDYPIVRYSSPPKAFEVYMSMQTEPMVGVETGRTTFQDEGYAPREDAPADRYVPDRALLDLAASSEGISSSLRAKLGLKSSSIDYGQRFGRSFRVCWAPDGRFLANGPSPGQLVRRTPVLSTAKQQKYNQSLMEIQQSHVTSSRDESDCPLFSIQKGDGFADKVAFREVLNAFAKNPSESNDLPVFKLIQCLLDAELGKETTDLAEMDSTPSFVDHDRTRSNLLHWIVSSCSVEVMDEVKELSRMGLPSKYSAVLSALSGGDPVVASKTAASAGFYHLASLITSGSAARQAMSKDLAFSLENDLVMDEADLRVKKLLSGETSLEGRKQKEGKSSFDWRRRLAMLLQYDAEVDQAAFGRILEKFSNGVADGTVPYPAPKHDSRNRTGPTCIMYNLLPLAVSGSKLSLVKALDPLGYSANVHDFSLAYHLAMLLTGLENTEPIEGTLEALIVDGYSSQLLQNGLWEWAVFLFLTSFGGSESIRPNFAQSAKALVLRYFNKDDNLNSGRRQLLQGAGVPSSWFEEALSLRALSSGDTLEYLEHLTLDSPEEVGFILKDIIIPNIMFSDDEVAARYLGMVTEYATQGSLAQAVVDLFQVHQKIQILQCSSRDRDDGKSIDELMDICCNIEGILKSYRSREQELRGPPLTVVPDRKVMPLSFFLAEALCHVALFKMRLEAIKDGRPFASLASLTMKKGDLDELVSSTSRDSSLLWFT